MAAGLSLKRVAAPILLLSVLFIGVLVIDQEIIIPSISHKLTRSHDAVPGEEEYEVWFLADTNGSHSSSASGSAFYYGGVTC